MHPVPHDLVDLRLAPLVLELDSRLEEMARLDPRALARRVALESDRPDWTPDYRAEALLLSVTHLVDLRGWSVGWHDRGLRLQHGDHSVVLGVPASFAQFVDSGEPAKAAAEGPGLVD